MFRKIADFFVDVYDAIVDFVSPSRYKPTDYGPMTEEDWEYFHDEVMRVFEAVKPRIRMFIDTTHTAPTMDDIQKMGEQEMNMLKWTHTFHDMVNCHKLHGRDNVWKHMREQLEPYTSEYIMRYITETKKREILSLSVCSIVKSQLNQKGLDYEIIPQKLRLKLEIKEKENKVSTYVISYVNFMKNPNIDDYIK
jgi:hypothetical protein